MAKKLFEYKNKEATDILADLIDPIGEIMSDKEVKETFRESRLKAAQTILKNHGDALLDILAIYNGIDREELDLNVGDIIRKTLEILNDKDVISVFTLQEQTEEN